MRERQFGPDVVRVGAFCLLLWLHFFLRNGFYYTAADTIPAWIAVCARSAFLCCVPLFLILTGYLKCGKPFGKGCYRSIVPILCSYLIINVIFLVYKIFVLKTEQPVMFWITNFFDFKLVDYGWYIEMYIGLFLIAPFINMAWNALGSDPARARRNHGILCLIAVFITFVPATLNGITVGEYTLGIFPAYFAGVYYITYYLIGCWFRTYPYRGSRWVPAAGVVLLCFAIGAANILTRTEAANYYKGYRCSYDHLLTVLLAVCLFLFFNSFRTEWKPLRRAASIVSTVTLEMYLLSYLFDSKIYVVYTAGLKTHCE